MRVYAVEAQGGAARLLLPLLQAPRAGRFAPRELHACANYYSSLFGALAPAGAPLQQADCDLLAQAIAAESPAWDGVRLQPLAQDAAEFGMWATALRRAGMAVQTYFCFGNWTLDVRGRSYREYAEGLPSRLKNTLARKSRQLAAQEAHFRIYTGSDEAEEGLDAFERVYRSSWKPAEAHPDFIAGLMRTCAGQGWLRLGVLWVGGQPAAAQLWVVSHGVASIYKLAYDERFAALSAGTLLTAHMMQHAIDVDRVAEVDYLTGDDAYKRDWMSHRRERWGIAAFNVRTLRGRLGALRHIGARRLKDWWRKRARSGQGGPRQSAS